MITVYYQDLPSKNKMQIGDIYFAKDFYETKMYRWNGEAWAQMSDISHTFESLKDEKPIPNCIRKIARFLRKIIPQYQGTHTYPICVQERDEAIDFLKSMGIVAQKLFNESIVLKLTTPQFEQLKNVW